MSDLTELYEVRIILETAACKLACERRSPEALDFLDHLLMMTEQSLETDSAYPIDHDFHLQIFSMVHNDALVREAKQLLVQLQLARSLSAGSSVRSNAALCEHKSILQAIRSQDPERASQEMSEHLQNSQASAKNAFKATTTVRTSEGAET
jgi:DNA-binding FadR family transcriptional regulator